MSAAELNPRPVRVSPLIKFGRWSLLSAGVIYGIVNHNRFSKKEAALAEIEAREKPIREAKLRAEKKRAAEAEMEQLMQQMSGTK